MIKITEGTQAARNSNGGMGYEKILNNLLHDSFRPDVNRSRGPSKMGTELLPPMRKQKT